MVRTYTCMILLVSALYGMEKNNKNKTLELLIYFIEGFEISTECVLIFLSVSCNLVMWYELDKK